MPGVDGDVICDKRGLVELWTPEMYEEGVIYE